MPVDLNGKVKCYKCHNIIDHAPGDKIYRDEECEHCGASIRTKSWDTPEPRTQNPRTTELRRKTCFRKPLEIF